MTKKVKCKNCDAEIELKESDKSIKEEKIKCPNCGTEIKEETEEINSLGKCPNCGSTHVEAMTRVTGFFSKVNSWNKGKIGELRDRGKQVADNAAFASAKKVEKDKEPQAEKEDKAK